MFHLLWAHPKQDKYYHGTIRDPSWFIGAHVELVVGAFLGSNVALLKAVIVCLITGLFVDPVMDHIIGPVAGLIIVSCRMIGRVISYIDLVNIAV